MSKNQRNIDIGLLIVVFALLGAGIVMVFSASEVTALNDFNDSYYFLKRQVLWALVGIPAMFFMANYDYHKLKKIAFPLLIITCISLPMVFIPGVGIEKNGSHRWINLGISTFQPSELAKLAIIIFLASSLSSNKDILKSFFKGLLPYLFIIGVLCGLVFIQKHLSSTVIIFLVGMIILFVAGAKIYHMIGLGLAGIIGVIAAILVEPYRFDRFKAFLDPWAYKSEEGYQVCQSLMAIGSGSWFGLGLGASKQKQLYIPEPHNDFVFSIIGEELGLLGAAVVLLLFLIFIWKGIKIAVHSPDMLGSLSAVGITSLIALQVVINVGVVTSSIPATGQPLPFFSAGGTSLVFLLAGVGILLNISKFTKYDRG